MHAPARGCRCRKHKRRGGVRCAVQIKVEIRGFDLFTIVVIICVVAPVSSKVLLLVTLLLLVLAIVRLLLSFGSFLALFPLLTVLL